MSLWDPLLDAVRGYWQLVFGTLAGLLVSFVFYVKSLKVRRPYFARRDTNLISELSGKYLGLQVAYNGKKITNFTSSRIVLWNGGRETVDRRDVVPGHEIGIAFIGEAGPLALKVIHESNPANQVKATLSNDGMKVLVDFEYLDHNDGAVIQVLHSGKGEPEDYQFVGDVKGHGKVREREVPWFWRNAEQFGGLGLLFAVIAGFSLFSEKLPWPWNLAMVIPLSFLAWALMRIIKENASEIPLGFQAIADPPDEAEDDDQV